MINVVSALNKIQLVLQNNTELSELKFIMGFPGAKKPAPLTKMYVVLGIDKAADEKKEVYTKDETPVLQYNRYSTARIRFDIFVPETSDGIKCYEIFCKVANYIMGFSSDFEFVTAGCGTVTYERDEGAFVLNAYMDVEKYTLKAD